jgi:subtilisin
MRTQINLIKNKGVLYLTSLGLLIAMVLSLFTPGIALAEPPNPTALTDSYIIVFKDVVNSQAAAPEIAQAYGLQTGYIYEHALKGMSAVVPLGRLAALQKDPRVAYVVEDMVRGISAQTVPTGIQRIFADTNANIDIDGADDYRVDVDVAVIDTGIDLDHPDLNVVSSTSCLNSSGGGPPWSRTYYCGAGGDDDHYHGTHVAGTIAALDNGFGVVGVAPGARLWAVKVCDAQGSCPSSAIIAGIDHVTANADSIEVANMSLGGSGFNQAEYDAIQKAVNAGVAFAVAAGNSDADANNYSPAAFDNVLTVSALADFDGEPGGLGSPTCRTDQDDTLADFSNWGSAVDIAAPGVCIYSTFPIEQGEYGTISGTSMASPHAAGALALLASTNNPGNATDVHNLYNQVISNGNFNWTDDSGDGIKEPLLDVSNTTIFKPVLIPGSGGGGGNTAPSVTITNPADGASFTSDTSINFVGTVTDAEEGDLTDSLSWTSSIDGPIGMGGSFSAVLTVGTHTITASVTDSGGLTGSASITVFVTQSGGGGTITVASLAGSSMSVNRNFWKATVTITVDPALLGAVVSGSWSTGGTFSCTTDSSGICAISSNNIRINTVSTTFTVSGVVLSGYDYVSGVTTVTVNKP